MLIRPGQISSWWDNFCAGQEVSKKWKENFHMPEKVLRNYKLSWDLTFWKTRDFEIQYPWRNNWPQHYITLQMKIGCEKWQILLVSGNRQFWKLSGGFCFYFRKFFPCFYLTKQRIYFANRKLYRTSLFVEN